MMTILLIAGCVVSLIMLVAVGGVVFMVMQAGERDTVSAAREDWIHRRSKKDEQGW
jgi:hypothetical protein